MIKFKAYANTAVVQDEHTKLCLTKAGALSLVDEKNQVTSNTDFKLEDTEILVFWQELLAGLLPKETIEKIYLGSKDGISQGMTSMYTYAQIQAGVSLYNMLKNRYPLFEIGTKRVGAKSLKECIEKFLGRKLVKIGAVRVYNSDYLMYEDKETGVLLSLCVKTEDRLYLQAGKNLGVAVFNSSYCGLIVPGFELTQQIAEAIDKDADCQSGEMEWPENGLGAVNVNHFFPDFHYAKDVKMNLKREPKILALLDKFKLPRKTLA